MIIVHCLNNDCKTNMFVKGKVLIKPLYKTTSYKITLCVFISKFSYGKYFGHILTLSHYQHGITLTLRGGKYGFEGISTD